MQVIWTSPGSCSTVRQASAPKSRSAPVKPAMMERHGERPVGHDAAKLAANAHRRTLYRAGRQAEEPAMRRKTVLVIDSTGRGHALCDLFVRTSPAAEVYYAPGCPLIKDPGIRSVPEISLKDPGTCLRFLEHVPVDFTFVSHIDALTAGYVDILRDSGHAVIGPTRDCSRLESSKAFGKAFCSRYGLPTAAYREFLDPVSAVNYVRGMPHGCVVKTDDLTDNGDGAIVCYSAAEAEQAISVFESRGDFHVIVEQRLIGTELSVLALLDTRGYLLFPSALDYKRALEGDRGPNCDGMGSVAPHPLEDGRLRQEIADRLLDPFVRGLRAENLDYSGFVYIGCIITADGLKVLEINARFGDSEAEVVLPSIGSDFAKICEAIIEQRLADCTLRVDGLVRCSVALVQGGLREDPGWPFGAAAAGWPVLGYDRLEPGYRVFLANITSGPDGDAVTAGGRVLHVVGTGGDLLTARENAYSGVHRITFAGKRFRTDIADFGIPLLGGPLLPRAAIFPGSHIPRSPGGDGATAGRPPLPVRAPTAPAWTRWPRNCQNP